MKKLPSTPIAEGRTAEIYVWDDRYVLKLYRDWCPPDWVGYEARIAGAVFQAGISSPEVGGIIEVNGRRALLYQRLEGIPMLQDLNARPWMLWNHARSLAEMQVKINQKSIAGLPSYKDRLRYDIHRAAPLTEGLRQKALALLDALPDGNCVCHGDYHPANVLITKSGPVAIDWMTACTGRPWADVARTSLILGIGAKTAGDQVRPIIRVLVRLFQRIYLNRYRTIYPDHDQELEHWLPVIAAARLNEDIPPEREELIKMIEES